MFMSSNKDKIPSPGFVQYLRFIKYERHIVMTIIGPFLVSSMFPLSTIVLAFIKFPCT